MERQKKIIVLETNNSKAKYVHIYPMVNNAIRIFNCHTIVQYRKRRRDIRLVSNTPGTIHSKPTKLRTDIGQKEIRSSM